MNILFLDQFSEMGGAQQGLLDTVAAARERGWRIWAALPGDGPLIDRMTSLGVTIAKIPCGPYHSGTKRVQDFIRFGYDLMRQVRLIGDLMNGVQFDLMYVNGPRLLPAAAILAGKRRPVLFHAHSHVEQRLARRLANRSIRRTGAAIVACSHSVMAQFNGSADCEKRFIVPNGVHEVPFRRHNFGREGRWRIGIIARISPEKGQAEFVRAAALLRHEFPQTEFVICGSSLFARASYFREVQELARGLPVEFLGWRDDVASVLSELDLLIVPSRQEGMGRVVVEAFSAGTPVVAFAVGGVPEVVTDRETGFLVRNPSPESLAECIRQILRGDPQDLCRIAASARQCWETSYNVRIYQERITQVMERLTSCRSAESETEARLLHK